MSHENPSKVNGTVQSQQICRAYIVDDKDPDEKGRYLCKIHGAQDGISGDKGKLQWVTPIVNGHAQLRTMGRFPGTTYFPGSEIYLLSLGGDDYTILGSTSNERKEDNTRDFHHNASTGSPTKIKTAGKHNNPYRTFLEGKDIFNELWRTGENALRLVNGLASQIIQKGNPLDSIWNFGKTPQEYGERWKGKVEQGELPSIGEIAYNKGDLLNLQKFMQTNNIPSMIPNALQMIEQLKQTVKQGLNIKMVDSVGGLQNILSALQGIASSSSKSAQSPQQENKKLLKEELYRIYRLETNKEPLDRFGNETLDYKQWETNYLIMIGETL